MAGATGLIGSQLLELLLRADRYEKVIAITRQPLERSDPKFQNVVTGLEGLGQFKESFRVDDVFCCLGTTMGKAKTREAFRKVDFEYPVALAQLSKEQGARQFLLVSALGANKLSSIFYNRVKGETEEAIATMDFESYHILRPSLLLGNRTEHRAGEGSIKWVYNTLGFLIPWKYKGVESSKVARAMLELAAQEKKGRIVHESDVLQSF